MTAHLPTQWRDDAAKLRRWGAVAQAVVLETCAAELETYEQERALEALTLEEAAKESGYSYSSLQKKLGAGELPNVGTKGSPRVRRADLPRKGARVEGVDLLTRLAG